MRWTKMAGVAGVAVLVACGGGSEGQSRPDPNQPPSISVQPAEASPGEEVTVRAAGFSATNTVVIGFGPPQSEYEVLRQVRTADDGSVSARVEVPSWAETGRSYVWVVADRDNEPRVISREFDVTR